MGNLAPLAHVVGNHHEDAGEYRERDEARQRGGEQQDTEQSRSMNHPGYRSFGAGPDVGRGARDRAGCGQTAKDGRDHVGDALSDEFDIRIVPIVAHAVRDYCGHQGFDGSQHRDGERRP